MFKPKFYAIENDRIIIAGVSEYQDGETVNSVRTLRVDRKDKTYMINGETHRVDMIGAEFGALQLPLEALRFMEAL